MPDRAQRAADRRAERLALSGVALNLALGVGKLAAGLAGNAYALVADAAESLVDVFGSLLVYAGLRYSRRPADDDHPWGHGRAESLAALAASALIAAVGFGIAWGAVERLRTPPPAPEPWTLLVLVGVIAVKEVAARRVRRGAVETASDALAAEAWHHRSDAITSLAALLGVGLAVVGGPAWRAADPVAALLAAAVVLVNAGLLVRTPLRDLMDTVSPEIARRATELALADPAVVAVEQAHARRMGRRYWIDMHAEVPPDMTVEAAHRATGRIKEAIRRDLPQVAGVLIHVEPAPPGAMPGAAFAVRRGPGPDAGG